MRPDDFQTILIWRPEGAGEVPLIFILRAGGLDNRLDGRDVEARMIAAMKLDRLSPRLRGPKAPGNSYVDLPDDEQEPDRTAKPIDASRAPLLRVERDFVDATLGWFSYLADESEAARKTFAAWLACKAKGQAPEALAGRERRAQRQRRPCSQALRRRHRGALNAEGAAKVAIPNAGRFEKPMRKAA